MHVRLPNPTESKTRKVLPDDHPDRPTASPAKRQSAPASARGQIGGIDGEEVDIPIDQIDPPETPLREDAAGTDLDSLVASLDDIRLLHRITVRPKRGASDRYEILAGERRFLACKRAGWSHVPCLIRDVDDVSALKIVFRENLDRREVPSIEIARRIERLCRPLEEGGLGLSARKLSLMLGRDKSWASQYLRLLRVPQPWLDRVERGEVNMNVALHMLPLRDQPDVLEAIEADYQANPSDWKDHQNAFRMSRYIAERVAAEKQPQSGARPPAAGDEPSPTGEGADKPPRPPRWKHRRKLSEDQAQRMLRPFSNHRAALETLLAVIQTLLAALPEEEPAADNS